MLSFSDHESTYYFLLDGKYYCPSYKKDNYSYWKIENHKLLFNHFDGTNQSKWMEWNPDHNKTYNIVTDWIVESTILGTDSKINNEPT